LETFSSIWRFLGIDVPVFAPLMTSRMLLDFVLFMAVGRAVPKHSSLPRGVLNAVIRHNSFERKSKGRQRGIENTKSHYRKGVAGDWKNWFTPDLKDAFKQRYPGLLEKLQYESDDRW